MKRFAFRLEKVLRLRQQETEQAKRAFAVALAQEAESRRALAEAETRLAERIAEVQQRERGRMVAFDFAALRHHVARLQGEVGKAEAALAHAREHTLLRRNALVEARRRERTLERLKERRLEVYQSEALRDEQKELDEFADRLGLNGRASRSEI